MKRILITGMPATGKSSVIAGLAARGYRAIDLDDDGRSFVAPDGEWVWDEQRVTGLLDSESEEALILGGCAPNQGRFYPRFDAIVLLSAPSDVIVERLTSRTNNPYGKQPEQRLKALRDQQEFEPVLRRRATHEIDTTAPLEEVVAKVASIAEAR
jgi:dephospho-CoA kinase